MPTHIVDNVTIENLANTDRLYYRRDTPTIDVTTTTTNGTLTLDVNSKSKQVLLGTATGYSIVLPNATTLNNTGWSFEIFNETSQPVTVKYTDGSTFATITATSEAYTILRDQSTTNGIWTFYTQVAGGAGLIYYKVTSSTIFTTTSTTDVLITGMSVTPQTGTYVVWFNGTALMASGNKEHFHSIYNNGAIITDSERSQISSAATAGMIDSTITVTSVTGAQALDVRVRTPKGVSLTIGNRTIIAIRIAN